MTTSGRRVIRVSNDIIDLVPAYLEGRWADVAALATASLERDFGRIAEIGARLKGVAATYGLADLSTMGVAVELAAQARQLGPVRAQIGAIATYLESVQVVAEVSA